MKIAGVLLVAAVGFLVVAIFVSPSWLAIELSMLSMILCLARLNQLNLRLVRATSATNHKVLDQLEAALDLNRKILDMNERLIEENKALSGVVSRTDVARKNNYH